MVLDYISGWTGQVEIENQKFPDVRTARQFVQDSKKTVKCVVLHAVKQNALARSLETPVSNPDDVYKVTVKKYMTKPSTPDFDFMHRCNRDIPMPMSTMIGIVEKETPGMVYVKLHDTDKSGNIYWEGWIIKSAIIDKELICHS